MFLRNNFHVQEEISHTNGEQNLSHLADEPTTMFVDGPPEISSKHLHKYVRGNETNGMQFRVTLNAKGQVLNDEPGKQWREILHGEALRLFSPTMTKYFCHQGKTYVN